ncbi:hypothetical protein MN202_01655 [Rheinheimera muenzenbergensis]|uniref:Uncharacterized protein n=1 Tax=Rheinheimera muenzenbergensis TaxID=1193628 RepID=A0ABU8C1Z6_9GAMM
MQTSDKINAAEQQLIVVSAAVDKADYEQATEQLANLMTSLQQIFVNSDQLDAAQAARLQLLSEQIDAQLSLLSAQQQQIKDSLGQIAAVKSANKIKKTYQIG